MQSALEICATEHFWKPIGGVFIVAELGKLVRSVATVFFAVTQKSHVNAVAVAAVEFSFVARADFNIAVDFIAGIVAVGDIITAPISPNTFRAINALELPDGAI